MNIFVLDKDHIKNAEYHCDKHIIKMILESAQLLSTACRLHGLASGYRETHINHPCSIWVRKSLSNWLWLQDLICALNDEFRYRYNHSHNHKAFDVANKLPIPDIPDLGLTNFALAMPDEFKTDDAVLSYRRYYIEKKNKIVSWRNRNKPYWYLTNE